MSPPAAPWGEQVEQAAADRIAAIVAGDDYFYTPVLVSRSLVPDPRESDTLELLGTGRPVVGVLRRSGAGAGLDDMERYENRHPFAVAIYVKGDPRADVAGTPDKLASRMLLQAQADVIRCLRSDPTLGGVVEDLDRDGPAENDEGADEPFATLVQPWVAVNPGDDEEV
jgi:hypothetical protein